ncbi:TPA: hypothetical protein MIU48_11990 [Klebsiella pneumoniae]|nr:hypothetical protein [Klebsiella pneumoniae]
MRKTIDSSDDKNMTIQRQYYYLPNIAMLSEFCAISVAKSHILYKAPCILPLSVLSLLGTIALIKLINSPTRRQA